MDVSKLLDEDLVREMSGGGASGSGASAGVPDEGAGGSRSRRGSLKRTALTDGDESPISISEAALAALGGGVACRGRGGGSSRSLGSSRFASPHGGARFGARPDTPASSEGGMSRSGSPVAVFRDIVTRDGFRKPKTPPPKEGGVDLLERDPDNLGVPELMDLAKECAEDVTYVARKSGHISGPFVRRLKMAASSFTEICERLAAKGDREEARRNRANQLRVERLLDHALTERAAFKQQAEETCKELAAMKAGRPPVTIAAPVEPPVDVASLIDAAVERAMERMLAASARLIDGRLAGLEDRLLPAPIVRPPLAADKKKIAPAPQVTAAPSSEAPLGRKKATPAEQRPAKTPRTDGAPRLSKAPPPEEAPRPAKAPRLEATHPAPASTARAPRSRSAGCAQAGSSQASQPTPSSEAVSYEPLPGPSNREGTWAAVVGRKARAKAGKKARAAAQQAQQAATPAPAPAPAPKPAPAKKGPKLVPPKTAAVVVKLRPEAEAKGTSYKDVMQTLVKTSTLVDLDLAGQVRVRPTMAGARLFEVPAAHSGKAAELAAKMAATLTDMAVVVQPVKTADLRITELDDSASKETVVEAVVAATGCLPERIKVLEIRPGPGGMGTTIVACPVAAAKQLAERGRVFVGWTSAKVVALEPRPMRCYRCLAIGHTRPACPPTAKAREKLCFRCGSNEHKIGTCKADKFRCAVCADAGRRSDHLMGGRSCFPPMIKGRLASAVPTRTEAVAAVAAAAVPATPAGVERMSTN